MARHPEPFYNADYFSDDPVGFKEQPQKRKIPALFGALLLLVGGSFFVQTTLASSISLNAGAPVEFGQGVSQATACDSSVVITPISSFSNSDPAEFKFAGIRLSDIDATDQSGSSEGCLGRALIIKAYGSSGSYLGSPYSIIVGSSSFLSGDGVVTSSGQGTSSGSATLTFENPTISADSIFKITIESQDTGECLPSLLAGWKKVYETVNPTRTNSGVIDYVDGCGVGDQDAAAKFAISGNTISKIRYVMELTVGPTTYYADVSFDAWDGVSVAGLQIPDGGADKAFILQRNVTNMSVTSNYPGVVNGTGLAGRLEIWPGNYWTYLSGLLPSGNSGSYDFDDLGETYPGFGSFQVHNLRDSQTVLAWNNHQVNQTPNVGFGNSSSGHSDWTFDSSLFTQSSSWKLSIYLR
jgi:hypothetical protein